MFTLVVVGLLGGLITSLSPCILPVLPIVLAAGMTARPSRRRRRSGRGPYRTRVRRPVLVVAGLVVSFSLATLFGSLILSSLGLPQDTLRDAGIAVLIVVGLGMLIPKIGELLERPFARLQRRAVTAGQPRARPGPRARAWSTCPAPARCSPPSRSSGLRIASACAPSCSRCSSPSESPCRCWLLPWPASRPAGASGSSAGACERCGSAAECCSSASRWRSRSTLSTACSGSSRATPTPCRTRSRTTPRRRSSCTS